MVSRACVLPISWDNVTRTLTLLNKGASSAEDVQIVSTGLFEVSPSRKIVVRIPLPFADIPVIPPSQEVRCTARVSLPEDSSANWRQVLRQFSGRDGPLDQSKDEIVFRVAVKWRTSDGVQHVTTARYFGSQLLDIKTTKAGLIRRLLKRFLLGA